MGEDDGARLTRYLPQVAIATVTVAVAPVAVAWTLTSTGTLTSTLLGGAVAIALSLLASWCGAAVWKRAGRSELLFADLMIWSWGRRLLGEFRVTRASRMLGADPLHGSEDPPRAALLERLALDLQARDPYTQSHVRRVARYASLIGKRMGLTDPALASVRLAAMVHDVGKINVPRAILNKPGGLSDDESELMKQHAADGARMVSILGDEALTSVVRHHHERLDGSGYPDGLSGDAIPLGARIIAVADTFDAIISTRPYRRASSHKRAMDVLAAEAGTKLDEAAVEAFRRGYAGRRELGIWVVVAELPQRVLSLVGADLSAAGVVPLQASLAAVAVTAALGGPLLRLNPSSEPHRPVAASAAAGVARVAGATRHASARSPIVSDSVRKSAAPPRPPAHRIATLARATAAATPRSQVVSVPTGAPPLGPGGGSGSGGTRGSGRPVVSGGPGNPSPGPGAGVGGPGGSGPPASGAGGPQGSGGPAVPPAPTPTLTDRLVSLATGVTEHIPAPVGPPATSALNSLGRTLDRILPAPL